MSLKFPSEMILEHIGHGQYSGNNEIFLLPYTCLKSLRF